MLDGAAYGKPSVDIESNRYKAFLIISGGIGLTPMSSIYKTLLKDTVYGRIL